MEPLRVLLIEDNPADTDYILERLTSFRREPIGILTADRLAAGIRILSDPARRIDAAILDLSLPDAGGISTVIQLRAAAPALPIVILTGSDNDALWTEALAAGAQDYLLKGKLTADTLVRSIKYAIVRKRLADEQEERARRLRELDSMKNDFIQMVNHELATPLAAISESLSELKKPQNPADRDDFLSIARRNANRLHRLTADLIDLTRLDSGRFDLTIGPVDLHTPLDAAVQSLKKAAQERGVRIEYVRNSSTEAGHSIQADAQRLEQVFLNLLKNAVEHARSNISVRIETSDSSHCVIVEDDGPGIDPDEIPLIFQKFFRGRHSSRSKTGTGLGLYIAKSLVEAHGGSVTVQNLAPPLTGARFTVKF